MLKNHFLVCYSNVFTYTILLLMSKTELKKKFLDKLELFYRNFGDEWNIEDFASNLYQQEFLLNFLKELQDKGVVCLNNDGKSFTIIDLPSNHQDLIK